MLEATEEYIELLTSGLSSEVGVKIIRGEGWHYNLKTKTLTYDMEDLKYRPFDVVRGLLLHEIGHLLFTSSTIETPLLKQYGEKYFESYNAMEDIRIEGKLRNEYGSFAGSSLEATNEWCCVDNINRSGGDYSKLPKVKQFLLLMLMRYYSEMYGSISQLFGCDADWCYEGNLYNFDAEVKKIHYDNKYEIRDILSECMSADTTADMQKVVDDKLFPIMKPLFEDNSQQKQQPKPKATPPPPQGGMPSPKGNQKTDGQSPSKNDGKDGSKQDEPKDGQGQSAPTPQIGESKAGTIVNPQNGNGLMSAMGDKIAKVIKRQETQHPSEKECKALLRPYSGVLAQRLNDVLKEKATTKYTGLHNSGKLLSRNAYKVGIPGVVKLFSRKSTPDTPQYAVTLCMDASGSMEGEKAASCFTATALLKDVCEKMKFKVNVIAYERRAWLLDHLDDYTDTGGGTCDAEALKLADRHMSGEDENLVFIITDGATSRNEEFDIAKRSIERKNGTIFGIGIGDDRDIEERMHENYEHAIHVPDVKELSKTLINIMRATIKR